MKRTKLFTAVAAMVMALSLAACSSSSESYSYSFNIMNGKEGEAVIDNADKDTAVSSGALEVGEGEEILITSDIVEHAEYWTYEAPRTELRITVVEAPDSAGGFLATSVY